MELFRFVALARPSASLSDAALQIDLEKDLASSALAKGLRDPAGRDAKLKKIGASTFVLAARLEELAETVDAFIVWRRKQPSPPSLSVAVQKATEIFGAPPSRLIKDPTLLRLRATLAEHHLLDRLAPSLRPKAGQVLTRARLQGLGLIEWIAVGAAEAERALKAPFLLTLRIDPDRFRRASRSVTATVVAGPGAAPQSPLLLARDLDHAERELKAAFNDLVSEGLEDPDDDDDFDGGLPTGARARSRNVPPDPRTLIVNLQSDPQGLRTALQKVGPRAQRVFAALAIPRNSNLGDALTTISRARRESKKPPAPRLHFRPFSSGVVVDTSAGDSAPLDGAPTTVGSARIVGTGRLLRVVDEVIGYRTAQLSEVYNVPGGSSKERELRVTERTEETSASATLKATEQETSTESEERFSLASESRKLTAFDAHARAGGSFSAGYGPVSVEASAEAGVGFRSEAAEELSTAYSKNVVSRATTRVTERVEELRRRTTFRERVLGEKEAYTNPSTAHITGIYQWINEVHEARLLEYDERLMLEIVVPKPGAHLLWAANAGPVDPALPQPPREFDVTLDDPDNPATTGRPISRDNYLQLAADYGAVEVPAPPEAVKVLMKAMVVGDQAAKGTFMTVVKSDESLRVPDGYEATQGWTRLVASRAITSGAVKYRLMIGTSQYKFKTTGSQRTFVRALDIREDRGHFRGSVPISVIGREDRAVVVHVFLYCVPTEETMAAWRGEVFAALYQAHQRALRDYQDAAGSSFRGPSGRNPDQLRRIERDEIKRGSLTSLTGQHFETFNALPAQQPQERPPQMRFDELKAEESWIRFFETAVEWEHVDYVLYPYFWSDHRDWIRALTLQVEDPKHQEFLRAGAARVLVPVRRGFEAAILRYLESTPPQPLLWDGLDPELIDIESPLYLAVWQELKERQGQLDEEPELLDTWRFEVPTSHRMLRSDGVLPAPPPET